MSSIRSATLLAVAGLASVSMAQVQWELVLSSALGNSVPGTSRGEIWRTDGGIFDNPRIDNKGNVLFGGLMDSAVNPGGTVTTSNRRGIWYGGPGSVFLIARDGQNGTDPNTDTFLNLPNPNNWWHNTATNASGLVSFPTLSPGGTIYIASSLNGSGATSTTNTAFWTGTVDNIAGTRNMQLVAQRGWVPGPNGLAPGANGATWATNLNFGASQFGINDAGQIVFTSTLAGGDVSGTTNNDGMWIGSPGNIQLVMRKGQAAPANANDATLLLDAAPTFGQFWNGSGQVAWVSRYRVGTGTPAVGVTNNAALFLWSNGVLTECLRSLSQIQGLEDGVVAAASTQFVSNISILSGGFTNSGELFITAKIIGTGVTVGLDDSVILRRATDGNWSIVARQNDPVPGYSDVTLGTFNTTNSRANNRGSVYYAMGLQGPGAVSDANTANFISVNGGPLQLIARQGAAFPINLPGLPADTYISTSLAAQSGTGLNNLNQVVFSVTLNSAEFPAIGRNAVLSWTPTAGLQLLALEGPGVNNQFVTDMGSDARLVTINPFRNAEGGCSGFSDTGWIVMRPQDLFGREAIYRYRIPNCVGDFTADGSIDGDDVIAFFGSWDLARIDADVDGSGGVDGDDVIFFFAGWDNGC